MGIYNIVSNKVSSDSLSGVEGATTLLQNRREEASTVGYSYLFVSRFCTIVTHARIILKLFNFKIHIIT